MTLKHVMRGYTRHQKFQTRIRQHIPMKGYDGRLRPVVYSLCLKNRFLWPHPILYYRLIYVHSPIVFG